MNTLLRYFNISSSYAIFHAEIEKFRQIMTKNRYPETFFFDEIVRLFLASTELIAPKKVVVLYHHMLAYTLFNFQNKSLNYFPLPIRIFSYGKYFDRYKDCRHLLYLKIAFCLL